MKKFFLVAIMAVTCSAMLNAQANKAQEGWNEFKSEVKSSTPRAIGANLGTTIGFSYQQSLGASNMLDVDVNFPIFSLLSSPECVSWGLGASITYDWINPFNTSVPWNNKGEWNWAMGVGVAGGFSHTVNNNPGIIGRNTFFGGNVGVAGHIGIAYDFWFPMELSFDWRPEVGIALNESSRWDDEKRDIVYYIHPGFYAAGLLNFAIGIRYKF